MLGDYVPLDLPVLPNVPMRTGCQRIFFKSNIFKDMACCYGMIYNATGRFMKGMHKWCAVDLRPARQGNFRCFSLFSLFSLSTGPGRSIASWHLHSLAFHHKLWR
jgi:hypothetical protein